MLKKLIRPATPMVKRIALCALVAGGMGIPALMINDSVLTIRPSQAQDGSGTFDDLTGAVRCRNGAGRRVEGPESGPGLTISANGDLTYRWREYGVGGRGGSWTTLQARARLSDLSSSGATANRRLGECRVVELFCRTNDCVSIERAGANGGRPRYASRLVVFVQDEGRARTLRDRLIARLREQ